MDSILIYLMQSGRGLDYNYYNRWDSESSMGLFLLVAIGFVIYIIIGNYKEKSRKKSDEIRWSKINKKAKVIESEAKKFIQKKSFGGTYFNPEGMKVLEHVCIGLTVKGIEDYDIELITIYSELLSFQIFKSAKELNSKIIENYDKYIKWNKENKINSFNENHYSNYRLLHRLTKYLLSKGDYFLDTVAKNSFGTESDKLQLKKHIKLTLLDLEEIYRSGYGHK